MIRDLIIEISPAVIVILIIVFSIIKVSIISVGLNKNYFSLFLNSFLIYNKVTIRNTFHEKLKEFYKRSNNINIVFYILIVLVLLLYFLMKSI